MTERPRRPAAHRSVVARLVLVMLVMALCLMGLVVGFFLRFVNPALTAAVERTLGDDARRIAASSPGLDEARRLASQLDLQIRYEGPGGGWTTDPSLPTVAEAQAGTGESDFTTAYSRYVVDAPNGGRYLFAWEFGRTTRAAHDRMLMWLLALMLAVFAAAHVVFRRALRPLGALQEGVARMSAGDLDVSLPNLTRDEFGVLTDAFNGMAARVRQMVVSRDQLLLDVSHELRSPLTRLKVALALLPDSAKKAQAESDVAEMGAMIGELLEFERLREGRTRPLTHADLGQVLHEAARPWQEGPPGVRVLVSPPEIPVAVDVHGVRTVLRNLLGNAVKYSLPDSRPVELSLTRTQSALVLRVVDDGSGIPEADLARVFDPFFRVDRSRSRKTGGYGLGLSICKRIVEAHGGRIEASNNPGRGACFTLTFPPTPRPD
jgi:signal transduction histidine kinase